MPNFIIKTTQWYSHYLRRALRFLQCTEVEHIISSCVVYFESVPLLWTKHIMIWCKFQERYVNSRQNNVDQMTPWREALEEASTKFSRTRNTLHFREPITSSPIIQTNKQTNTNYNTMLWKPSHRLLERPGNFCTFVRLAVELQIAHNYATDRQTDTTCGHFVVIFSFLIPLIGLHITGVIYDSTDVSRD
jgi:hypothetical protein